MLGAGTCWRLAVSPGGWGGAGRGAARAPLILMAHLTDLLVTVKSGAPHSLPDTLGNYLYSIYDSCVHFLQVVTLAVGLGVVFGGLNPFSHVRFFWFFFVKKKKE